jgi:hypothetical protein
MLAVRGNRVMHLRHHTIVSQILAQSVTAFTEDREDVPHAVAPRPWDDDIGVVHLIYIYSGNLSAACVVGVEIAQLGVEDGGLQLVEAGVAALVVEDVLT